MQVEWCQNLPVLILPCCRMVMIMISRSITCRRKARQWACSWGDVAALLADVLASRQHAEGVFVLFSSEPS